MRDDGPILIYFHVFSRRQSSYLSFTAQYTRSKLFNLRCALTLVFGDILLIWTSRFKETEPVIIRATSL